MNTQVALLQCSAAIAQGIQVYFVGNFSSLAQTVFITCSVRTFQLALVSRLNDQYRFG